MNQRLFIFPTLFALFIIACSSKTESNGKGSPAATATTGSAKENYLSMKINGVEWKADSEIFGAFHPKGYNKAIIIAGSKGPKDKNEQAFNLNLYNTNGPAVFLIKDGNPDLNVVQMGNFSPENYLYGSMMGFDMKVNVSKASTNEIEATFEGTMKGNAGDVMKITEGKFYYRE